MGRSRSEKEGGYQACESCSVGPALDGLNLISSCSQINKHKSKSILILEK